VAASLFFQQLRDDYSNYWTRLLCRVALWDGNRELILFYSWAVTASSLRNISPISGFAMNCFQTKPVR